MSMSIEETLFGYGPEDRTWLGEMQPAFEAMEEAWGDHIAYSPLPDHHWEAAFNTAAHAHLDRQETLMASILAMPITDERFASWLGDA